MNSMSLPVSDFDAFPQLTTTDLEQMISEQALMVENHQLGLVNYPAADGILEYFLIFF